MMRLNPTNFFTHFFLLDHQNPELDKQDQDLALGCSIALGILSLGTVHATCALIRWCIAPADKSDEVTQSTDQAGRKALPKNGENEQKQTEDKTETPAKKEALKEKIQKEEIRIDQADQEKQKQAERLSEGIEKMSQSLTADNFGACMQLAFEHNVPNAIWRGLVFAAEHPEEPALKKLIPTFYFFASETEKQIGNLIKIGQECHANRIVPSITIREQRIIRLECESFKLPKNRSTEAISQDTIWSCLQKLQSLASIEELDTGEYELVVDKGHDEPRYDCDHFLFIRKAASLLPNLKELKLTFDKSFDIEEGSDPKNELAQQHAKDGKAWNLPTLLKNSFKEIEGIGISFPYNKKQNDDYLTAFKEGALVSQAGKPIQLRSLVMRELSDDQLQELAKQIPSLHDLRIENASITQFLGFPHLERLEFNNCSQLIKLNLQQIRYLKIDLCKELTSIDAPEAKEIRILAVMNLKTLEANCAENLYLHETGLEEVTLPSAKTLHFVPPGDNKVSVSLTPDTVTVPQDCIVGRRKAVCEVVRIPPKS